MKTTTSLHHLILRHHQRRAKEETDPDRQRYHRQLAVSVLRTLAARNRHDPMTIFAREVHGQVDWHDSRQRWCERMRAAYASGSQYADSTDTGAHAISIAEMP